MHALVSSLLAGSPLLAIVPPLFGIVRPKGSAAFVVEHHYNPGTSSQAVSFAGAAAGNLAVIAVHNNLSSSPSTPSGWTLLEDYTWSTYGYHTAFFSKVLSSGDISTGSVTFTSLDTSDSIIMFLAYSGVTAPTIVSSNDVTTAGITIPGFTKNAASKGIVTFCLSRDPAPTMTPPAGTASRTGLLSVVHFAGRANDIVPSTTYTNGTGLTYANANTNFTECIGRAIELT